MQIETLQEATRRYRLRDSGMRNADIAEHLGAQISDGDFKGSPISCFFVDGYIAAIRTKQDEMAVFHLFQHVQVRMADIGDKIE